MYVATGEALTGILSLRGANLQQLAVDVSFDDGRAVVKSGGVLTGAFREGS